MGSELPMPPCVPGEMISASTSVSPWYGKLRCGTIHPNPTKKNLGEQVYYRQVKRKQRPALVPQTKDPAKQMTELLTAPVAVTTKARILRMLPQCSSGHVAPEPRVPDVSARAFQGQPGCPMRLVESENISAGQDESSPRVSTLVLWFETCKQLGQFL